MLGTSQSVVRSASQRQLGSWRRSLPTRAGCGATTSSQVGRVDVNAARSAAEWHEGDGHGQGSVVADQSSRHAAQQRVPTLAATRVAPTPHDGKKRGRCAGWPPAARPPARPPTGTARPAGWPAAPGRPRRGSPSMRPSRPAVRRPWHAGPAEHLGRESRWGNGWAPSASTTAVVSTTASSGRPGMAPSLRMSTTWTSPVPACNEAIRRTAASE